MTTMPVLDTVDDNAAYAAMMAAYRPNRDCLRRPVQLYGEPFEEVRKWCTKTGQWKPWPVVSRQGWAQILPVVDPNIIRLGETRQ